MDDRRGTVVVVIRVANDLVGLCLGFLVPLGPVAAPTLEQRTTGLTEVVDQRHADVLPCRVTDVGLDVVECVVDHIFGEPLVVRRVAVLALHIRQVGVSFGGWVLVFIAAYAS